MSTGVRLPSLPVWTAHWPAERLRAEEEASPRAFARGFRMKAFTDDERMFPSLQQCFIRGLRVVDVARRGYPVFIGADLSSPTRPGNVIFTAAMDPGTQQRYPLEIAAGNWTSPELAKRLHSTHDRYPNVRCILVETNGMQAAVIDWIKQGGQSGSTPWWWKVEAFTTGANKSSMMVGLPSLELECHKKLWSFPHDEWSGHPTECKCGWCTFESEATDYPMAAQTDHVMAWWFCREAMSRWGGVGNSAMAGMVPKNLNSR